jgi:MFS family permease
MDKKPPSLTQSAAEDQVSSQPNGASKRKGIDFWLSFVAILSSVFLSALDLTAVSTALPTITSDLHGEDKFTWVGSAYALSSTAFLPLCGALADIFGRKPVMLSSIFFFALGSALAGAAQNMDWLIAARSKYVLAQVVPHTNARRFRVVAIQGVGGGSILSLTMILVSDLVPLAERGAFQGVLGLTWSFACGIGPPIVRS